MFSGLKLYAAIGLLLVVGALVAGLLWYRAEAISATAGLEAAKVSLKTAEAVNQSQRDALDKVTTFRARDDAILLDVNTKLEDIAKDAQTSADALDKLKTDDPEAKAALDTAVPDSVIRLLK